MEWSDKMRLGKYMMTMFLCLSLTACSADGSTFFHFNADINLDTDTTIMTLDHVVEQSDLIALADLVSSTKLATGEQQVVVLVIKQFKGEDNVQDAQLTVISPTEVSNAEAQYLLFIVEQDTHGTEDKTYRLLINANPIVNHVFVDGTFKNMAYKDIRTELMASIKKISNKT